MSRPDVVLREVRDSDLESFYANQRDAGAAHMAAVPSRERDAFFEHWQRIRRDERIVVQTVLANGDVAGNVMSFPRDGRCEVGYWIGRAFWGRGIATRAVGLFLERLEERPVYAYVAKENTASRRVLEKCGFTPLEETDEGVLLIREL